MIYNKKTYKTLYARLDNKEKHPVALFKFNDESVLVSLNVGSRSLSCAVFQKSAKDPLDILAFSETKSAGIEKGQICNLSQFAASLNQVLEAAEELSQTSFSKLTVGFNPDFSCFHSQGMAVLSSGEVEGQDIESSVKAACAVPLPDGHICLHKDPESFSIDGGKEVSNPLGMSGLRLSANVRLITVPDSICKDLLKALKYIGQTPVSLFHNLPAFAQNLIEKEDKQKGVCFCDLGHKSSRLMVFHRGKTEAMFSIPIGGWHFTQALALKFNLTFEVAEKLKLKEGNLFSEPYGPESAIDSGSSLYLPRKLFAQTLENQAEDLLQNIKQELLKRELMEKIPQGFVFNGRTSLLPGFLQLASFQLGKKAEPAPALYDHFEKTNHFALIMQTGWQEKAQEKHFSFGRPAFFKELF